MTHAYRSFSFLDPFSQLSIPCPPLLVDVYIFTICVESARMSPFFAMTSPSQSYTPTYEKSNPAPIVL